MRFVHIQSQNRLSNLLRTGSRRRADGSAGLASSTDFQRDYLSSELDRSEGTSESSLTCLATPAHLIADIQELARSLLVRLHDPFCRLFEGVEKRRSFRLHPAQRLTLLNGGQNSFICADAHVVSFSEQIQDDFMSDKFDIQG